MILKHRDRELLRFEWVEPQGVRVVSLNDAERRFLPLEDFLQKRAREILEYGTKADDLLHLSHKPDSVNHVSLGSLGVQIKRNDKNGWWDVLK